MNETAPQPPRPGLAWPYVVAGVVVLLALALFSLYSLYATSTVPDPPTQKLEQQVTTTGEQDVSTLRRLVEVDPDRVMVGEI